jgi:hypothetical protein
MSHPEDSEWSPIMKSYEANVKSVTDALTNALQTVGSKVTGDDRTEIQDIVAAAAALALECSSQKSRIQTFEMDTDNYVRSYSKVEVENYNKRMQEDEDAETLEGYVELYISPGLKRIGDGRGGSLNEPPKILSKAQVFLNQ